MHDELPLKIRSHLDRFASVVGARWQIVDVAKTGFSGSVIYPIQIAGERYALRNWNWSVDRCGDLNAKLKFQQLLVRCWIGEPAILLSSGSSIDSSMDCPVARPLDTWASGQMVAQVDGSLWTLATWRPGQSVGWAGTLSSEQLRSIAGTLARMHRISLAQESVVLFSPGWQDRLARLQRVANTATLAANSTISALAAQHDSVFRTLRGTGYFEEAVQWVRTQAVQPRPACWIVRDAHQENWLFESDNLSGVVDFGAARCDWPTWDLIRLWSSAGVSGELRAAFVGIYLAGLNESASRHIEALSKSVESLVNDESWHRLDYLQNLLSAWQWRTWSVEERDWSTTEIQRWQMLLQRLG